jgi:hypothetical protein
MEEIEMKWNSILEVPDEYTHWFERGYGND